MGRRFICTDIIHKADPEHEIGEVYFLYNYINGFQEFNLFVPHLSANKTYEIVWDNESYTLSAFENIIQTEESSKYKIIFLGNDSLISQLESGYIPIGKNTEYPFCFGTFTLENEEIFAYLLPEEDTNDHTFSIYEIIDENKNIYFRNSDIYYADGIYFFLGPSVQEGDELYVSINGGSDVAYKVQRNGNYLFIGDFGVVNGNPISDDSFLIVFSYGCLWMAANAQFTEFDFEGFRPSLPDDIVLKDASGTAQVYSKAHNLVFDSSQEGIENIYSHGFNDGLLDITSLDFSFINYNSFGEPNNRLWNRVRITKPETLVPENIVKGIVIAGVKGTSEGSGKTEEIRGVDANFSTGSQYIYPSSTDKTMSQAVVYKPDTLVAENIAENVNIAGITGTLKKITTEEKAIDLDFSNGDMSINADAGKAFSKVDIVKPTNLEPNNIINGINIAGVEGTFEAPTLYSPTIAVEDDESGHYSNITITMPEENGSFCNTLEVYDDNGEWITAYEIAAGESKTIKDVDLYNDIDGEQQLHFRATAKGFVPGEESVDTDMVGFEIEGPGDNWTSYGPAIKTGSSYTTIIAPYKYPAPELLYLDPNNFLITSDSECKFTLRSPVYCYTSTWNSNGFYYFFLCPYGMGYFSCPSIDSKTIFSYGALPKDEKPVIPQSKGIIFGDTGLHIPSPYVYKLIYTLDNKEQEYRIEYPTIKYRQKQYNGTYTDIQIFDTKYLWFIGDTGDGLTSANVIGGEITLDFSTATVSEDEVSLMCIIYPSGKKGIKFNGELIAANISKPTYRTYSDFSSPLYYGAGGSSDLSMTWANSGSYIIPTFVFDAPDYSLPCWYINLPDYKEHSITVQFYSYFEESPSTPQTFYNVQDHVRMSKTTNSDNEPNLKFYNIKTDIVDTIEVYINDTLVDTLSADATESALLSTYEAYDASIKNTYQIRVIGPDTDAWSEPYVET